MRELRPLPGDTVGQSFFVNDHGVAVGSSGTCANSLPPPFAVGPHAVLWARDGSVTDLGNLGGTANPALLLGNVAFGVNNSEHVTGISALPGSLAHHAFLWTKTTGMRDLGTLPGDLVSAGLAINNRGEVVGVSNPGGVLAPTARAVLWQKGEVLDLNTLVPADTALYLLTAFGINDHGQIAGFGVTKAGEIHAYLATPTRERKEEGDD